MPFSSNKFLKCKSRYIATELNTNFFNFIKVSKRQLLLNNNRSAKPFAAAGWAARYRRRSNTPTIERTS